VNCPFIIGLTGSIAMGKSTVAQMFEDAGIAVFDADACVHRLQGAGSVLLQEIEKLFPGTTSINGTDRQKLGAIVLGDAAKLSKLEAIIHPAVAQERADFLATHHDDDILVFDIPLLFEKGGEAKVDAVIVVSASSDIQKQRVLGRPGMTEEKYNHIMGLQMPDAEKRRRADYVIDTAGSLKNTRTQLDKVINKLRAGLAHQNK
jgi:dephospho-CoA kinase